MSRTARNVLAFALGFLFVVLISEAFARNVIALHQVYTDPVKGVKLEAVVHEDGPNAGNEIIFNSLEECDLYGELLMLNGASLSDMERPKGYVCSFWRYNRFIHDTNI